MPHSWYDSDNSCVTHRCGGADFRTLTCVLTIGGPDTEKGYIERREILCYNYCDKDIAEEAIAWIIPLFLQDLSY